MMAESGEDKFASIKSKKVKVYRPGFFSYTIISLVVVFLYTLWSIGTSYGTWPFMPAIVFAEPNLIPRTLGAALVPWLPGVIAGIWSFRNPTPKLPILTMSLHGLIPAVLVGILLLLTTVGGSTDNPDTTGVKGAEMRLISTLYKYYPSTFNEVVMMSNDSARIGSNTEQSIQALMRPSIGALIQSQAPFMTDQTAKDGIAAADDGYHFMQSNSVDTCVNMTGVTGQTMGVTGGALPATIQAEELNWYAEMLAQTAKNPRALRPSQGQQLMAAVGLRVTNLVPPDEHEIYVELYTSGRMPSTDVEMKAYCDTYTAIFDVMRQIPIEQGAEIFRSIYAAEGKPAGSASRDVGRLQ
ncbi:MAG: hypothetical protein ACREEB_16265 [Caulobacteraceae bacterium]